MKTHIEDYKFAWSKAKTITIPDTVKSIGESAFYRCSKLTRINIPKGVTSIGNKAFSECRNLEIVINNSEDNVEVGKDAFKGCKSVKWLK